MREQKAERRAKPNIQASRVIRWTVEALDVVVVTGVTEETETDKEAVKFAVARTRVTWIFRTSAAVVGCELM